MNRPHHAGGFRPFLSHLILPAVTLSIVYIALIASVTRSSMQEMLGQDHVRTAPTERLSERRVLLAHALSNAAVPIIAVIAIRVVLLIGGVMVTKLVFGIPGLGRQLTALVTCLVSDEGSISERGKIWAVN